MRMRGARKRRVRLARKRYIVGELSLAAQEPRVLQPAERFANPLARAGLHCRLLAVFAHAWNVSAGLVTRLIMADLARMLE
jgi:hypothetical protein